MGRGARADAGRGRRAGLAPDAVVRLLWSVAMHDVFLELLDNPRTFPLLTQLLGWNMSLCE